MAEATPWERLSATQKLSQVTRRDADPEVLGIVDQDPYAQVVAEMRHNRRVNSRRTAGVNVSRGGASISLATQRSRDPFFYWQQNNLPYDYNNEDHLKLMRDWARLLFATHPVIGSAIEIMSRYPLTGMELVCKDQRITDFYTDLFFDQLDYETFLVEVGREIWSVGEAFPLGSFNESLGVWEDEELINPNFVDVIKSPFLKEPRFEMALPDTLREVLKTGRPAWEYQALMQSYPELKNFMGDDARMPVSNVLLRHLKWGVDTFNNRGIPILARAFRTVMQEEMLNAAQDAIADRLYTPLILAKLGATAQDLGAEAPWIPNEGDLMAFEESLDAALAGDFRIIIHHFGVNISSVFGRETMPNLNNDFDRITDKILQVFGMSKTMLTGASSGQTYAADALNRDLLANLLMTHQKVLRRFFRDRALVVAEAQQHYDYEERGGKRYPIFEEIVEIDEETGEERIVEVPKLLIPDLKFRAMDMRSEESQRAFLEELRDKGVPISMKTRLVNVPVNLKEEYDLIQEEQVEQAVRAQEARKETFLALTNAGLPIPDDLQQDFGARAIDSGGDGPGEVVAVPTIGATEPADTIGLAPTPEDLGLENESEKEGEGEGESQDAKLITLPRNRMRPPESDEQRAGMPRSYVLRRISSVENEDEDGNVVITPQDEWYVQSEDAEDWNKEGQRRLLSGPSHLGRRAEVRLEKDVPLEEQLGVPQE